MAEQEPEERAHVSPAVRTEPLSWGRRFFVGLLAVIVVGASILVVSVSRNAAVASEPSTPRYILVAVVGVPSDPGFTGFLVHIEANRRILGIIPIPGSLPSYVDHQPLWFSADKMTGRELVRAIHRDLHIRAGAYVKIPEPTVNNLFTLLTQYSSSWPAGLQDVPYTEDVPMALYRLGWDPPSLSPPVTTTPGEELRVLTDIMGALPDLPTSAAGELSAAIQRGHPTDLSAVQLFLLGTVIRGYNLQMDPLPRRAR